MQNENTDLTLIPELVEVATTPSPTKIAIVTYNRIGNGQYDNGIIKNGNLEIYLVQDSNKAKWGVPGSSEILGEKERDDYRTRLVNTAVRKFDLTQMDFVVLYVGSFGAEQAIGVTRQIPADRIAYVLCKCNYETKIGMIEHLGHKKSPRILSECGGRETLEKITDILLGKLK